MSDGFAFQFELYAVYRNPMRPEEALDAAQLAVQLGVATEVFEQFLLPDGCVRALRVLASLERTGINLGVLRDMQALSLWRWLEFGWRAYVLVEGRKEHAPWRKNQDLDATAFKNLIDPAPMVRYHLGLAAPQQKM